MADSGVHRLPPGEQRRLARRSLLRSLAGGAVIVVGYFVLPMDGLDGIVAVYLGLGLLVVAVVLAWQIREITRSPYPRIRAVNTLATCVPLLLVVFAAAYYLMELNRAGSFTEPLTRSDAMYFTVTVLATVGFGDIAPVTEAARLVVTVQIIGDLLLVGLGAKALLTAVQAGLRHQQD
ncbi:potassium channel family protein [Kribbella sp. CA-245084]|uniref:potassium channel family protein n=1 Tax=Kribbella sp. CA-245084 TaxID=3239940 RepID=UPI003D9353FF